jgi:hypothetical protein
MISITVARPCSGSAKQLAQRDRIEPDPMQASKYIHLLADSEPRQRIQAAQYLFDEGKWRILDWLSSLKKDEDFRTLLVHEQFEQPQGDGIPSPRLTVGVAVLQETFDKIRVANGSPPLAEVSSDQDVAEFELEFAGDSLQSLRLDILTTKTPGGNGAIARFLGKFGEGIQQIEIDVTDVDRATEILRMRFKLDPIYPATRAGANGTRMNFFLVAPSNGKKVLVELVEQPKAIS